MIIPGLANLSIAKNNKSSEIMMDFISITVIVEFDNWFGSAFELFLDTFYKEETISNPDYLDFKISFLDQISSLIFVIQNTFILELFRLINNIWKKTNIICLNFDSYSNL